MADTADFSFTRPSQDDLAPIYAMLEQALAFAPGGIAAWAEALGADNMRVVRRGGQIAAAMGAIPFGHWVGGRVVPTAGITAVGVAPGERGGGVGLWMLRQALAEQRAQGVPIATLYPATTAFYRRNGFERAAVRTIYEIDLAAIGVRDHALETVAVGADQIETLKQIYAQVASRSTGWIDRPDFYWQRMLRGAGKPSYALLVQRDGVPEGYVIFAHAQRGEPVVVQDAVALTPAAGRRILTVLADNRSVLEKARFAAAPNDPLLLLLPEQNQKVFFRIDLMLRILDVPAALAARGYAQGVSAELHLHVDDDLFPENSGPLVLRVADGRGVAERGGSGRVRMGIRDLAALYTGFISPFDQARAGALQGPPEDLAALALAFSGPQPWLPDMF